MLWILTQMADFGWTSHRILCLMRDAKSKIYLTYLNAKKIEKIIILILGLRC